MAQEQVNFKKLAVIGGSSGSLEAAMQFLPLLQKEIAAPVVLVMHRNSHADSSLVQLLASKTALAVKEAEDKDLLSAGNIYVVPPDYHLLFESDGTVSLDASEKIHYCRPSIDVSLTSAAEVYGKNLTAVLLSGANADGADGMLQAKLCGGHTIIQDMQEAVVSFMPAQAMLKGAADEMLTAVAIAAYLNQLA